MNHRTRGDTFLAFKNTVQVFLEQHSATWLIMAHYPALPEKIKSYVNEGLAAFLHIYMNINVHNLTSSVERGDSTTIDLVLQQPPMAYASVTPLKRTMSQELQ